MTVAAFQTLAVSRHTEQFIIMALRAARALSLSLVAELDGRVIGYISFSPVTLSDGTPDWYGPGPVSVLSAYQRQGVGKALDDKFEIDQAIPFALWKNNDLWNLLPALPAINNEKQAASPHASCSGGARIASLTTGS
ncbi:MAG TPA: GNAT family N-acetyltransferase [Verrucomicrobiota bacterium]|nr:GNAT family N-acetyltransferase [Verrucomicrobiota bacterium]